MRGTLRNVLRGLVGLSLLTVVTTCSDEAPVTSPTRVTGGEITDPASNMNVVSSVTCTADVEKGEIACGDVPVVDGETGLQKIIVGGQGVFVQLVSSAVSYNSGTQIFQADVQVGNRIPQGLGSADGLTTTGIRVFHHSGPTVTVGTGTVTVANADGTGTFTGSNQPYFSYDTYLPQLFISGAKTWQWSVPVTATTFTFEVYVDADVVSPSGFVQMSPGALLMSVGGGTETVSSAILDHVGRVVAGTVTYTSADPTIASVNLTTGEITAVSAGIVDIIGTSGGPETDGRTRVTIDPPTAGYDIDFHFLTSITASQEAAFTAAAAKWTSLITTDLPTDSVGLPFLWCGGAINEYVDDLAINVIIGPIDGPGNTLGQAAPCFVRSTGSMLPSFGFMQFDEDDVATLEGNNQFEDVVLHEMGHVLGIGSLWAPYGFLADNTGSLDNCPDTPADPFFTAPPGNLALTTFNSLGGSSYTGNKVPAEDGFGSGTRCVHWRESVLDTELMTGISEASPTAMPLSEVTVKSLADMGYGVASSGWDTWTCPFCSPPAGGAPRAATEDGGFQFVNDVLFLPLYTRDASGQVVEVRPGGR